MHLYEINSSVENLLATKADFMKHPLGGTMELSPLCNMKCQMCFIRQDADEMKKRGRMLSYDEWLRIAKEAKDLGVLFLLITGGEPLIYPEFERLYKELIEMGFIITVNTNGTLIDEKWADFFAMYPCRRLNITLYGKDNESYGRLCKNPCGHTQVMKALQLLNERNIPYRLNYTVMPDNKEYLKYACELAKEKGLGLEMASYLFPPLRCENENFQRLTPQEAAQAKIDRLLYLFGEEQLKEYADVTLLNMHKTQVSDFMEGLTCRAGHSGFWLSWNGEMLPCGMFDEPRISLLEHSFDECWKYIVEKTGQLRMYKGCKTCDKKRICIVCAASCLCESGDMTKKPEYVCETTEAYYELLKGYATEK